MLNVFPLLRVARDSVAPSGQNVQHSTLNLEYWTLLGWPCESWLKKSESTPPSPAHIRIFGATRIGFSRNCCRNTSVDMRGGFEVPSGAGSVQGARLSSVWLFNRNYELAAVTKAISLKSQQ